MIHCRIEPRQNCASLRLSGGSNADRGFGKMFPRMARIRNEGGLLSRLFFRGKKAERSPLWLSIDLRMSDSES